MAKQLDTGTLVVKQLIAHQVPRRRKGDDTSQPTLSEAIPQLPDATLDFFRGRLKRALQHRGQPVEVDSRLESPVLPPLLEAYLSKKSDLVDTSRKAANHLFGTQPGSPHEEESLFVACEMVAMGHRAVAVMKLEREEGVLVEETKVGGKPTFNVTVLDDLMLTDNTRVFKAGVFWLDDATLYGHVSDDQQGHASDVADYFLNKFLGCRLQRRPGVVTKHFYEQVADYISKKVNDPERKLDYYDALQTEINSNRKKIDPIDFINDNFHQEDQKPLRDQLKEAGIPTAAFEKDTSKLGSRPRRSRLRTASGLTITGSPEEIHRRVAAIEYEGADAIVIRDTLTGL